MILDKYPNLCIIPMIHNVDVHRTEYLPLVIINLSSDGISLSKGEIMGFMQIQSLEISEIMMETSTEPSVVVCEEKVNEVQNATLENDVIIEHIIDAQGRKVKKLKPLFIKSEPDREHVHHIHSDDNLPSILEEQFTQK